MKSENDMDSWAGIDELLSKLESHMYHPVLVSSLRSPDIHRPTLVMGSLLISGLNWTRSKVEAVLCALLLVHHGLSIHDDVEPDSLEAPTVERQLTVLAGDFFSSKYYRLLADQGLYSIIRTFARAIQSVNETKTRLAERVREETLDEQSYLAMREQIGQALLYELADELDCFHVIPRAVLRMFGQTITLVDAYAEGIVRGTEATMGTVASLRERAFRASNDLLATVRTLREKTARNMLESMVRSWIGFLRPTLGVAEGR